MVAYSFKRRFVEPIVDGRKGGTIRADRRRHVRPGEEMQLYVGMRTKQCRLIARKTCLAVEPITLDFVTRSVTWQGGEDRLIRSREELDDFAAFDGFRSFTELSEFWVATHGRPERWHGWHILWAPNCFVTKQFRADAAQ
jgi:uncharacterized protein YqfB (UPF0267 family)